MKKIILSVLFLLALCVPSFAGSWDTYFYNPWQTLCATSAGSAVRGDVTTTSVVCTLEAGANNNVVIDRIYASGPGTSTEVDVLARSRLTTYNNTVGWWASAEVVAVKFPLVNDSLSVTNGAGTGESIAIGSASPEIPLWIGDKGKAYAVRLISSNGTGTLSVNYRIGTMPTANPSTYHGY